MIYQILLQRLVPFGFGFFTAVAAMGIFGYTGVPELEKGVSPVQYSSGSSRCKDKTNRTHNKQGGVSPYRSRGDAERLPHGY